MEKVLIIVNAKVKSEGRLLASPVTERMIGGLTAAIERENPQMTVEVATPSTLKVQTDKRPSSRTIYCPLTIQIPEIVDFPARECFRACQNVKDRRAWVQNQRGFKVSTEEPGLGDRWLPIVFDGSSVQFGEVIGEGEQPNAYQQPVAIAQSQLRALQALAVPLLKEIAAPPSVYLLQFLSEGSDVLFDRLWPFPAAPAIASLNRAPADLFGLYWQCIKQQQLLQV